MFVCKVSTPHFLCAEPNDTKEKAVAATKPRMNECRKERTNDR